MKVCVQGLWHLGSVVAACVASLGNRVVAFDFDAQVVESLNAGRPPVSEPGLQELIQRGAASGALSFTSAPDVAMADIEVLWIAYDTPVDNDDVADVEYVMRQVERVLPFVPSGTCVLISSQLPVGSVRRLEKVVADRFADKRLTFACSPENLRLGHSLDVFLHPDRIVVGVRKNADVARLERLLKPISPRIEWMNVESAEMTKHAINAFLATSVTFANEIASLCEIVGADAMEVERGLKTESRIGPKAYLSPGGAFAGGTLARDIAFLGKLAATGGQSAPLLSSIKLSNDEHKTWALRKLRDSLPTIAGASIAVWGLTYKPGTDTLRRSSSVELCHRLLAEGARIFVHDPAVAELPPEWGARVKRTSRPLEALVGAQALVVATEWPEYRDISAADLVRAAPGITVIDANRHLSALASNADVRYLSVGTATQ